MGQEITKSRFSANDFDLFHQHLSTETQLLKQCIENKACSDSAPVAGLELEAWLIDQHMHPAPINERYLAALNDPLASAELAKFNIELNTQPITLSGGIFSQLHQQLDKLWADTQAEAIKHNAHVLMIGTLPTIQQSDLCLKNMSDLNRYRALNEQILCSRGKPIQLDITGVEHLHLEHKDVMLESAATSLQLHTKVPLEMAHHFIMRLLSLQHLWWPYVQTPPIYLANTYGMSHVSPFLNNPSKQGGMTVLLMDQLNVSALAPVMPRNQSLNVFLKT